MSAGPSELRRRGYSQDEIAVAQRQQEATRRAGGAARTLNEIIAGKPARARPSATPEELTQRQLRRRGRYGQAALLTDQEALSERSPERAKKAREASDILKELSSKPTPAEFDFFGGNVTVGHVFHDAVQERLKASNATPAERVTAQAVLTTITRWLGFDSYECTRTATEIADQMGLHKMVVSEAIQRLESIGAVARIKRGRTKIITVTPEGAYRGRIDNHAEAVARYQAEVVPFRRTKGATPQPAE